MNPALLNGFIRAIDANGSHEQMGHRLFLEHLLAQPGTVADLDSRILMQVPVRAPKVPVYGFLINGPSDYH